VAGRGVGPSGRRPTTPQRLTDGDAARQVAQLLACIALARLQLRIGMSDHTAAATHQEHLADRRFEMTLQAVERDVGAGHREKATGLVVHQPRHAHHLNVRAAVVEIRLGEPPVSPPRMRALRDFPQLSVQLDDLSSNDESSI